MSEYVSKEELKEFFESIEITVGGRSRAEAISEVLQAIYNGVMELPTTDAVQHGKWIKADSQQYFRKHYPCFTCSECGYGKDSQKTWNYCPNCGADMKGENND